MQLARGREISTVTGDGYVVQVRHGTHAAVITDPDGNAWSRLMLLASLDRADVPDESYDLAGETITETEDGVDIEVAAKTGAWRAKWVRLRCRADHVEVTAHVEGNGTLGTVQLLGGRALERNGACGTFFSSVEFASVFDPAPSEPIQVVRPPNIAATLGVVGGDGPGRRHGTFAPPPLCLVLGRERATTATDVPAGDWLSVGVVAPAAELRFTELRYRPEDAGFLLELDYDGGTTVDGAFTTPTVVLRPASSPWHALAAYRDDSGPADRPPAPPWWSEPIFCGWGAQCARAAATSAVGDVGARAGELCRQDRYDEWLGHLARHGVVPGTVVIDDQWQRAYGTGEPDTSRWPDLRGWIAERHAAGQRVLLWWKAWDPAGLDPDECLRTPDGTPLAADPANPAYQAHLARIVTRLLGADGLDADGLKIDYLQRAPTGHSIRRHSERGPWGIALLHQLLETIYTAAKTAKPDALIVTHAAHPAFADVSDMIRLNDLLVVDRHGAAVPPVAQLAVRHGVVSSVLPQHLIDTDQWPIRDRASWRAYVIEQARRGVPSLYYADHLHYPEYFHYAERVDRVGDELDDDDLALVADTWARYRTGRAASAKRG